MCCEFDIDSAFLMIMTIVSGLIVTVDLKVLKTMFEEYFLLEHYMDHETYYGCYKPQTEMRMVMEGYAIYCAILCTVLTGILAINLNDTAIDWCARKIVNLSFLMFGPVLFTLCLWGWWNFKGLSKVCGISGTNHHSFNGVCIFLLVVISIISLCVTYSMAMQKTIDMASNAFMDENSMLYRMSQLYFRYQQRIREMRQSSRRRDREERRREESEFNEEEQRLISQQRAFEEAVANNGPDAILMKDGDENLVKGVPFHAGDDAPPSLDDDEQLTQNNTESIRSKSNMNNLNEFNDGNRAEEQQHLMDPDEHVDGGQDEEIGTIGGSHQTNNLESQASESEQSQIQNGAAQKQLRLQSIRQRIEEQKSRGSPQQQLAPSPNHQEDNKDPTIN